MSQWLRRTLDVTCTILWVSGVVWLVLQLFFRTTNEFGTVPHPWQPPILVVHGVAALLTLFVVGWVAGSHVEARLRFSSNRNSGIALLVFALLLGVTGFASFYLTDESLRTGTATIHEVLGTLALIPVIVHWLGQRRKKLSQETWRG